MTTPDLAHGRISRPSDYTAAWWLPGPHLQTLWGALCRRPAKVATRRERLELPDGDFLDLAWAGTASGPLVAILHGLEGDQASPYVQALLGALVDRGWGAVVMHFRGCGGEPNRLARSYHSGDTQDFARIVELLRERAPARTLAAVGYSLGGNVLLKYLGELGAASPLAAACAVSVPFDLAAGATRLRRGFSRCYQWRLLRSLRAKTCAKFARIRCPIPLGDLATYTDFWSFDDRVTAPLHGFRDAVEYYARSSSRQYLNRVATPTLIVHAEDDPFLTPEAVPGATELAPAIEMDLVERGGHVGFVAGRWPGCARPWLEARLLRFLAANVTPDDSPCGTCAG